MTASLYRPAVTILAVVLAALPAVAPAQHHGAAALEVAQPWARATPGDAPNGAAYLTIVNHGHEMDRLVGVTSPVSRRVEMHTHTMEGGMMRMRQVSAVEVHPGEPAVFRPGANHIMLIDLKEPLVEGESFPLTLTFDRAGPVETTVEVQGVGSMGPGGGMEMKGGEGGGHRHH